MFAGGTRWPTTGSGQASEIAAGFTVTAGLRDRIRGVRPGRPVTAPWATEPTAWGISAAPGTALGGEGDGGPGTDVGAFRVEAAVVNIDYARGFIQEPRDRTARSRLGADMADHQFPGCAAEPAVRDRCHRLAEPFADQSRRHPQHFPHARATARPFVTDDDVARADPLVQDGIRGVLF